jgi:hypothetical protein
MKMFFFQFAPVHKINKALSMFVIYRNILESTRDGTPRMDLLPFIPWTRQSGAKFLSYLFFKKVDDAVIDARPPGH